MNVKSESNLFKRSKEWEEVSKDPNNKSKSKQLWSFSKSDRFMIIPVEKTM